MTYFDPTYKVFHHYVPLVDSGMVIEERHQHYPAVG